MVAFLNGFQEKAHVVYTTLDKIFANSVFDKITKYPLPTVKTDEELTKMATDKLKSQNLEPNEKNVSNLKENLKTAFSDKMHAINTLIYGVCLIALGMGCVSNLVIASGMALSLIGLARMYQQGISLQEAEREIQQYIYSGLQKVEQQVTQTQLKPAPVPAATVPPIKMHVPTTIASTP